MSGAVEELARAALTEASRGLGLAGGRQFVDLEVQWCHHAIHVEFNPLGLATAVVGQKDVLPGVLLGDGLGGGDFDPCTGGDFHGAGFKTFLVHLTLSRDGHGGGDPAARRQSDGYAAGSENVWWYLGTPPAF